MTLDEYQEKALTTLKGTHAYGELTPQFLAQIMGLIGESGEIAEKVKKIIRDQQGVLSDEARQELLKEVGDVLWYVNSVAVLLGSSLEDVAEANLAKLASRNKRGAIHGAGDNR